MEPKNGYVAAQVLARAAVVLSRRGDLTVTETKKDTGLDLHVYVERGDREMRLMFGVLLRAVPSPTTAKGANELLKPTMKQFGGMGKFLYPVCLLLFTTREEQEFFTWLAEPTVASGLPRLVHHEKANCVAVTREVLDEMVERVVSWYDAVHPMMVA